MKEIIKCIAIVIVFAVVSCGKIHAQDLRLTKDRMSVFFAYSNDIPVIKEQSKISTIVYNQNYWLEKVDIFSEGGKKGTQKMRSTGKSSWGSMLSPELYSSAIDVLPGKHTFVVKYNEKVPYETGNGYATYFTPQPVEIEIELEAGCFYQIKAIIIDNNVTGLAVEKGISDESFSQTIIEVRNKYKPKK